MAAKEPTMNSHWNIYVCVYIYICVCVCVCVYIYIYKVVMLELRILQYYSLKVTFSMIKFGVRFHTFDLGRISNFLSGSW